MVSEPVEEVVPPALALVVETRPVVMMPGSAAVGPTVSVGPPPLKVPLVLRVPLPVRVPLVLGPVDHGVAVSVLAEALAVSVVLDPAAAVA